MTKSGGTLTPPLTMVVNPAPITKRVKKSKQPLHITKDLGRWKPTDDLLLINAVLQVAFFTPTATVAKAGENNALPFACRPQTSPLFIWGSSSAVASHYGKLKRDGTPFSTILSSPSKSAFLLAAFHGNLALLSDGSERQIVVCLVRLAWQAMRQLHPEAIAAIQSKALFSQSEEALLAKVSSVSTSVGESSWCISNDIIFSFTLTVFPPEQTSQSKLETFQELLSKHPQVFHSARTPRSLLVHWQLLKQYYLLEDQTGTTKRPHSQCKRL